MTTTVSVSVPEGYVAVVSTQYNNSGQNADGGYYYNSGEQTYILHGPTQRQFTVGQGMQVGVREMTEEEWAEQQSDCAAQPLTVETANVEEPTIEAA